VTDSTPYRTDRDALEQRLASLKAELDAARAEVSRIDFAKSRVSELEREVVDVAAKLAREARRSPLDDVRIAAPCSADWAVMKGDERVRFCGSCEKNVYDLSKMTRAEAEALLAQRETPCIRLYRRADGTVITADCPVGARRRRFKRIVASTVGGVIAGAMILRWRQESAAQEQIMITAGEPAVTFAQPPPVASAVATSEPEVVWQGMLAPPPPPPVKLGKVSVDADQPRHVMGRRAAPVSRPAAPVEVDPGNTR
jgi:hypothetical protein